MAQITRHPVVHLELHTGNLPRACGFYRGLFEWRLELVRMGSGSYLTLDWGTGIEGGVVEHDAERAMWLPYVEVGDIACATRRAEALGASVILDPREGPAGWRSVVSAPAGAEVALWQPKA
jgi:predicted enzyme related to lactoylglutathione lyase